MNSSMPERVKRKSGRPTPPSYYKSKTERRTFKSLLSQCIKTVVGSHAPLYCARPSLPENKGLVFFERATAQLDLETPLQASESIETTKQMNAAQNTMPRSNHTIYQALARMFTIRVQRDWCTFVKYRWRTRFSHILCSHPEFDV